MLTIKTEDNYMDAVKEMGLSVNPDAVVMTVRDGNLLMGIGVMTMSEDYAEINDISFKEEFKEFTLEYGLGKSMLNVVDLRGIRYAVSNNKEIEKQLRALKFKAPGELENIDEYPEWISSWELCLNLDGYFLVNC